MTIIKIIFWVSIFSIFYAYLGYPLLLWIILKLKKKDNVPEINNNYLPKVTLLVAAYNEEDYVDVKVQNSFELNYPKNKIECIWVTDGSNDKTNEVLAKYPEVKVLFQPQRNGKINAINRAMEFIDSEIVIFSDGNTLLSPDTVKEMVHLFQDKKVGCIAGEKRIILSEKDDAASAGEGVYWKYESWIKNMDAKIGSCVGAAGELFAIRRELFFNVPEDTILDDFIISLTIASKGYKVAYSPKAFAIEKASASINEEMKRKVRIAAGSIQSMFRLKHLLNPFKYKILSFQYLSHKIFRWVVVPVNLVLIFVLNILIVNNLAWKPNNIYLIFLLGQLGFYFLVLLGWMFKNVKISIPFLFVPYYFFIANLSMWLGFARFLKGNQSVNWERAKRAI